VRAATAKKEDRQFAGTAAAKRDGTFAEQPGFVFDTETTGVAADTDRIVELGAVCFAGGRPVDERRMRINPQQPIPAGASAIHGIYDADVASKPTFAVVAERFAMYLDGRMHGGVLPWLAAYNGIGFDVPLINAEFQRIGSSVSVDPARVIDPMIFVRWHLRHLRSRSLENICLHFGIDAGRSHSALDDARAAGTLLFRLIEQGFVPQVVSHALDKQAQIRPQIEAEWQDFSYWLYHDRQDGRLRLGAGSFIGTVLSDASPDYLRSLLAKVSDLPERVRASFLDVATHARPSSPSSVDVDAESARSPRDKSAASGAAF
jgi:DNA polymerase III epsilon subunit family exonuclease